MSRGRPKKTIPTERFGVRLPQDLHEWLESHLYSEVEDRVPHGAKSEFVVTLIRQYRDSFDTQVKTLEQEFQS